MSGSGATKTQNPGRRRGRAHVLPIALRTNQRYKKAYGKRLQHRKDLKTAVDALSGYRKTLDDADNYDVLDSASKMTANALDVLTPAKKAEIEKEISEWIPTVADEYTKFAEAHEEMRDIEKKAGVKSMHRLARTTLTGVGGWGLDGGLRAPGTMYGWHGINRIRVGSHVPINDVMEDVKVWGPSYQGGRRKKTRKKRRRKNKRKTKRRKKTRRRKKRRKKRRTKRR